MSGLELDEATRGFWVIGPDETGSRSRWRSIKASSARSTGFGRGIRLAPYCTITRRRDPQYRGTGRWEFDGEVAADLRDAYVGYSVGKGGQNPIRYVNV